MDLITPFKHMKNMQILVNGTTYKIDNDCIVHGVSENDAKRLLLGKWEEIETAKPKKEIPNKIEKPKEKIVKKPEIKWPEPSISLSMEVLNQMCLAYNVPFSRKIKKITLVRQLQKAIKEVKK